MWRPCLQDGYADPRPIQKWPSLHKRREICWIAWKIIFQIYPIFSFWVIGRQRASYPFGHEFCLLLKSGRIYREDRNWSYNDFRTNDFFVRFSVLDIVDLVNDFVLDIVNFMNNFVYSFQVFLIQKMEKKSCQSEKMHNILIGIFVSMSFFVCDS